MANCHFDQNSRPVPVAVVTDLNGNIVYGNYIDQNKRQYADYESSIARPAVEEKEQANWSVSGIKIMVTRFWATSTSTIVLVPDVPNQFSFPYGLWSMNRPEFDICIWMGYIDSVRPVTTQDLTDNNLIRCFVGIVENIKATGSASGGYTLHLQCRDRMRWMMNSSVFYSGEQLTRSEQITRSILIADIANIGVGVTDKSQPKYPRFFTTNPQFIRDIGTISEGEEDQPFDISPDIWYQEGHLKATPVNAGLQVPLNPELRIITTRIGESIADDNPTFNLRNSTPLDAIRSLSFQEIYPYELFQDHRTGHIYYVPRANDHSSLEDGQRFRRTYYFGQRQYDNQININQRLIAFREELSSMSMRTNFVVSIFNSNSGAQTMDDYQMNFEYIPPELAGIPFARSFYHVRDPSIKSAAEAASVGLHYMRIYGKAVHVGMAVMLGDPSLTPGEVVQISGSQIYPSASLEEAALNEDRQKYTEFATLYQGTFAETAQKLKNATINKEEVEELALGDMKVNSTAPKYAKTTGSTTREALNEAVNTPRVVAGQQLPKTIFRIEAVCHKFNLGTKGFTSEIALYTPF